MKTSQSVRGRGRPFRILGETPWRATAAALLCASPVLAGGPTPVLAGSDLLFTQSGLAGTAPAELKFDMMPIPGGFFGPMSDPFSTRTAICGIPLDATPTELPIGPGAPGQADTIVHRLSDTAPLACPGGTDTIPIEIVALNLVSIEPITVTFGGGGSPTRYEVRVCLAGGPQTTGSMTITRTHLNGGTFTASLPVSALLTFTKCQVGGIGVATATLTVGETLLTSPTGGCWTYSPAGLVIATSPGGTVDHDCDPFTPPIGYLPTSNFFPGVCQGGTCAASGSPGKTMTEEEALLAKHGILPPNRYPTSAQGFGDGSGTPCPCGNNSPPGQGQGCLNSGGEGGQLWLSGKPSVSQDEAVLHTQYIQGPGQVPVLFFQGTMRIPGGNQFGDGLRVASGPLIRLGIEFAYNGRAHYGGLVGDIPISIKGAVPPNTSRVYQGWYRDAQAFCTPATFNLTNAVSVNWQP